MLEYLQHFLKSVEDIILNEIEILSICCGSAALQVPKSNHVQQKQCFFSRTLEKFNSAVTAFFCMFFFFLGYAIGYQVLRV